MKAAVLTGIGKIELRDMPMPRPRPGEVRLRVRSVGVCGSDVHYYKEGRIGTQVVEGEHVAGHEFSAVVDALGPGVSHPSVGTRVAVEPGRGCGLCERCLAGDPHLCEDVIFFGTPPVQGAYCEYVVHPASLCFPVPDSISDDAAAMLEPLGVGIHAVRRARVELGGEVLVVGAGPIGLSVIMSARASGASRVLAADIRAYRLDFARRAGATDVFDAYRGSSAEWTIELTRGRGVDCAYECAGEQDSIDRCLEAARAGGRVALVGIPSSDRVSIPIHTSRRKELDLLNVRRSKFAVEPGIAMTVAGLAQPGMMVTHRFPLERIKEAFDMVSCYNDGVVKAVIAVSEGDSAGRST